jgi:hypothetical protein
MAKIRYFSATDGHMTVFRSSATRVYKSAFPGHQQLWSEFDYYDCVAVEITKSQFDALNSAKIKRILRRGKNPSFAVPQDSFVFNEDIS